MPKDGVSALGRFIKSSRESKENPVKTIQNFAKSETELKKRKPKAGIDTSPSRPPVIHYTGGTGKPDKYLPRERK
jgi:hypothetical protein